MADISVFDFGDGVERNVKDATARTGLASKTDKSVIAPAEEGTTASAAYSVGDFFIRNGAFCTVTAPIASGDTLTENTNYTAGQIADAIGTDLSNYIQKSSTAGLVKNDGSIDTNSYATTSQIPVITGKADKVTGAVSGNFAGLDSSGNLTDSGSKASDFLTSHQDISGKADNSVIAPVEATSTASQAYVVGDHFIRNGKFCTVIAAITSGGTLTLNTNYIEGNIASLLNYLEQTATLSTSAATTVTFSDARITTSSCVEVGISEWGLVPDDVTVSTGSCVVTLPKIDSAHSVTVRLYLR